ncbi:hypothetical protein BABINDRAFT_112299 [Babjeviella inositovora NRRL Y-12698]|uniref:Uncharacterized protein n=1 Tax=Babjeviella inositovora NRRL Y-12698 TaxID=984486 RepID=A0A1E3QVZ6_9ASCO|nr:uncharacterized protein BABINDRAFT_112299 [Babjeviella inositovora NRRL Y-12698]ODQ81846.1 hypothetical protein BABINDRAFT_112299 [Babjeviella inositovora NRRL Y-12698]
MSIRVAASIIHNLRRHKLKDRVQFNTFYRQVKAIGTTKFYIMDGRYRSLLLYNTHPFFYSSRERQLSAPRSRP